MAKKKKLVLCRVSGATAAAAAVQQRFTATTTAVLFAYIQDQRACGNISELMSKNAFCKRGYFMAKKKKLVLCRVSGATAAAAAVQQRS